MLAVLERDTAGTASETVLVLGHAVSIVPPTSHAVLIVDDNDDIRDAMALALYLEGFEVGSTASVPDAFRSLHGGFRPCVVLLDMHMPEMDGWDFLDRKRLTRSLDDAAVIVVSSDVDQRSAVLRRGCDFLLKPFDATTLTAAIGRLCRRHALCI